MIRNEPRKCIQHSFRIVQYIFLQKYSWRTSLCKFKLNSSDTIHSKGNFRQLMIEFAFEWMSFNPWKNRIKTGRESHQGWDDEIECWGWKRIFKLISEIWQTRKSYVKVWKNSDSPEPTKHEVTNKCREHPTLYTDRHIKHDKQHRLEVSQTGLT